MADSTLTGTIARIHPNGFSATILGDDGRHYFLPWKNLAKFGGVGAAKWSDVRATMRVRFTPAESDRAKDDPVAIMVTVIDDVLDGI